MAVGCEMCLYKVESEEANSSILAITIEQYFLQLFDNCLKEFLSFTSMCLLPVLFSYFMIL
jgi:hypothetical protein